MPPEASYPYQFIPKFHEGESMGLQQQEELSFIGSKLKKPRERFRGFFIVQMRGALPFRCAPSRWMGKRIKAVVFVILSFSSGIMIICAKCAESRTACFDCVAHCIPDE